MLSVRGGGAEAIVYLALDLFTEREVALKVGPPARLSAEHARWRPKGSSIDQGANSTPATPKILPSLKAAKP